MPLAIQTSPAPAPKLSGRGSKELREAIETAKQFTAEGQWFHWESAPKSWKASGKKLHAKVPGVEVFQDDQDRVIVRCAAFKEQSTAQPRPPFQPAAVPQTLRKLAVPRAESSFDKPAARSAPAAPEGTKGDKVTDEGMRALRALRRADRKLNIADLKRAMGNVRPGPWNVHTDLVLAGLVTVDHVAGTPYIQLTPYGKEYLAAQPEAA
jgi:hypothetical protein